jgi:hypothetical protein
MRNYSVTKKPGELHNCEVTDGNGNKYQNYFDTEQECINWIYYIWENESNSVDEHKLLHKAILNCKKIDKNNNNLRKIL